MSSPNRHRTSLQTRMIDQLREFSAGTILFNQKVAERVGLHLTDMQCMNVLDLLGTSTPGKLAEFMGLTTGGVTVMLDRLEKAGCITRVPNPDDRRSILVRVSAKRMEKIQAHYAGVAKEFDTYMSEVAEAELETVASFFQRINALRLSAVLGAEK